MRNKLDRREVLVLGRNMLLTSLVAGLPLGCSISPTAGEGQSQDHRPLVDGKGAAIVVELSGSAGTSRGVVSAGDSLSSGEVVTLAAGGQLVLSLPDRSVLQLKDETRLKLDLDSRLGGDLTLAYGSLLSVITARRRSRPYRIKGAAAQIDVKGTVCYLQTFKSGSVPDSRVPAGATDYFCICNGVTDLRSISGNKKQTSLSADHHNPYFLQPADGGIGFIRTKEMMDHDDDGILALINRMQGEKHDTSWLRGYY